jgi:hypothetical protein
MGLFSWTFADQHGQVWITQRASLSGAQAAQYAASIGRELESGIPVGMRTLCAAMEAASGI